MCFALGFCEASVPYLVDEGVWRNMRIYERLLRLLGLNKGIPPWFKWLPWVPEVTGPVSHVCSRHPVVTPKRPWYQGTTFWNLSRYENLSFISVTSGPIGRYPIL
jgi:hypothetical protein